MKELIELLPAIALILVLVVFVVLLGVAIVFNYRGGMKYRTTLAEQVNRLRLGRMLTALGIDIDAYIASERVVEIHQHIRRCGECINLAPCDAGLANGNLTKDKIDFCNNEQSLLDIINRTTKRQL